MVAFIEFSFSISSVGTKLFENQAIKEVVSSSDFSEYCTLSSLRQEGILNRRRKIVSRILLI